MGRGRRTVVRGLAGFASGVLVVTMGVSASATVPAKGGNLPKDACALLGESDAAELVPSASAEPSNVTATTVGCVWDAPQSAPGVFDTLSVTVTKVRASPAQIKASMQAEAKRAGAAPTKGLGDYGFQASSIPVTTEVAALKGKLVISVHFSGAEPVTDEQVAATLALAKKVVKKV